jgi:sulfatase modifying factor 1
MAPRKPGRAYYYRMRTPEKRLETYVKLAAIMAAVVVLGLIVAFGSVILPGEGDDAPPQASTSAPAPAAPEMAPGNAALYRGSDKPGLAPSGPERLRDCADCPPLVSVPAGSFIMGTHGDGPSGGLASETPAHGVTFRSRFALEQTEVTRGQFAAFVKETGYQAAGCVVFDGTSWVLDRSRSWRDPGFFQDDEHPVVCVSRQDADAYLKWLSDKAGVPYRLPSESEWEYAARAGNADAYVWGADQTAACVHANVADASLMGKSKGRPTSMYFACDGHYAFTAPVGKYQLNAFGLSDMLGNVREIVADCWSADYKGAPTDGAAHTGGECTAGVSRGGGWFDPPANLRTARRLKTETNERRSDQGFRAARDIRAP